MVTYTLFTYTFHIINIIGIIKHITINYNRLKQISVIYNSMEYTHFKTKVRLTNYTRERINDIGLCEDIKSTPDDWNFFQFLFTRHPNYPAKFENLKNVAIRYNERKRTQLECILIKNDGTEDAVSWVNCCNMRKADPQQKAMRTAIQPQIDMFKKIKDVLNLNVGKKSKPQLIEEIIINIHMYLMLVGEELGY